MNRTTRRWPTTREIDVLAFLLTVEAPEDAAPVVSKMRSELSKLMVVEDWECCPSFNAAIGDEPVVDEISPPVIAASHKGGKYQLLLFASARGGIRTLELVHFDDLLRELPPPEEWNPPTMALGSTLALNALHEPRQGD